MWESVGLLFLYLISGYLNKRKKDQKNREIESDPDWDTPKKEEGIDDLLLNLFNQKETLDTFEEQSIDSGQITDDFEVLNKEVKNELIEEELNLDKSETSIELNKKENFEDKIYHSDLADRKELHLGNKWNNKKSLKKKLFRSSNSIKRAFVLKEILDKPIALKK